SVKRLVESEWFDMLIKSVVNNQELAPNEAELLQSFYDCKVACVVNTLSKPLYHLLITRDYPQAFDKLFVAYTPDDKENSYVRILLAYCYLHQLGCDRDVVTAIKLLKEVFATFNSAMRDLATHMYERVPTPHNKSR
ncbi:MAG: hypothetical protein M3R00_02035, partial [Pseudomonadota bacterium]|nr:hypothetical protein [Pseudomonadota bacterium]